MLGGEGRGGSSVFLGLPALPSAVATEGLPEREAQKSSQVVSGREAETRGRRTLLWELEDCPVKEATSPQPGGPITCKQTINTRPISGCSVSFRLSEA